MCSIDETKAIAIPSQRTQIWVRLEVGKLLNLQRTQVVIRHNCSDASVRVKPATPTQTQRQASSFCLELSSYAHHMDYILCPNHTSAASAAKQEADSFHPSTSSRIQADQCDPTPDQRSSSACTCELVQCARAQRRPCMSAAQHAAAGRESPDGPELSCVLL